MSLDAPEVDSSADEPWKDRDILRHYWVEREWSQAEMAEQLGCSQPNVGYWLRKYDIKRKWRDEDVLRDLYVTKELSTIEIANRLGKSAATIHDNLTRLEIETRPPGRKPTHPLLKDRDQLSMLYEENGLSCSEIANRISRDRCNVRKWLKIHDIELRVSDTSLLQDSEWLKEKYVDEEMTCVEIADIAGVGSTTVVQWLRNHDIEARLPTSQLRGEDSPHWKGGGEYLNYGPNWPSIADNVRRYDGDKCTFCNINNSNHRREYSKALPVHHNIPASEFATDGYVDEEEAHRLDNVITTCVACHGLVEGVPLDLRHRPGRVLW